VVITQRGDEVQIDTIRGAYHDVVTYGVGAVPPGRERGSYGVIVAWEGGTLRTALSRMVSDSPVSIIEERRLSANGREMTVERQLSVEHGYQAQGVNTSLVAKDVYVRKGQ
jgi:hypothetical protein